MRNTTLRAMTVVGMAVLSVNCGRPEAVVEPELRPVRTEAVTLSGAQRQRTFSGTFRAGIESAISWITRCFVLSRCTWKGDRSFKSYVWSAIVAANLLTIARKQLA